MPAATNLVFSRHKAGSSPLKLLMYGYTAEESNRFLSLLREYGQAAQLGMAGRHDDPARLAKRHPIQVVVINLDDSTLVTETIVREIRQRPSSAAIILTSGTPAAHIDLADSLVVQGLIDGSDLRSLALAVRREHSALRVQRQLAETQRLLAMEKERFNALLHASRDAIAYLHEGMHVEANSAYCALFGLAAGDVDGLSIMDLVTREARLNLKSMLRRMDEHGFKEKTFRCRRADGSEFDAGMEFSVSEYAGESTVRLIIRGLHIESDPVTGSDVQQHRPEHQHHLSTPERNLAAALDPAITSISQRGIDWERLHIEYQPIVSLDGEMRANYRVSLAWEDGVAKRYDQRQVIEQARLAGNLPTIERWAIRQAISELHESRQVADLHFHLSREATGDDTLLPWICETLRKFDVRGRRLHFRFEASLFLKDSPALQRFVEELKKINCQITCTHVTIDPNIPSLLSEYQVDTVQYAAPTIRELLETSQDSIPLREFNQRLQRMGIKSQVGSVEDARTLTLLWKLRVNRAWGDFLQGTARTLAPNDAPRLNGI